MKIIKNKRYLVLVFIGLFNILLGTLERLNLIPTSRANAGFGYIVGGLIVLAIGLYLSRKPEMEVMPDERTKNRDMKVFTVAFLIVFLYVIFLMMIDVLWSVKLIDLGDFFLFLPRPSDITQIFPRYMSIISVAIISWVALTVYYDKKGDIE
jgi:hypothetical protein